MTTYQRTNKLVSPAVRLLLSTCHNGWLSRSTAAAVSKTFNRSTRSLYEINSFKWSCPHLKPVRTFIKGSARIQIRQHQHRSYSGGSRPRNRAIALNKKIIELGRNKQWKEILLLHQEEKESFNNVNYSTAMSQLGRIRFNREDPVFNQFVSDLAIKMETRGLAWVGLQSVANVMHALGKMNLKSSSAKRIVTLVSRKENAESLVNLGIPQDIANTAWAFARLAMPSPYLFSKLEKRAEWFVRDGLPQHIANTAWSCATLGVQSPNLFAEIEIHAKRFVAEANPQQISNTAWSCATLGVQSPNLFAEVETHVKRLVIEGHPQAIANTAWSCAKLGVQSPKLFAEIEKHAEWFVGNGNSQGISNAAWSFATIGFEAPNFFKHMDTHIEKLLSTGSAQAIANTCYSIQILDYGRKYESSLSALWDKALSAKITEHSNEYLSQLVVVEGLAKADGIQLQEPSSELRARMGKMNDADNLQSFNQKGVSAVLNDIGFAHEEEVSTLKDSDTGGMLSIDLACKERKIAIEYDGPSHYLRDVGTGHISRVENGPTKAKRRFLERSGWTVANVNYQDWNAAKSKGKARDWLCQKLRDVGVDWSDKKMLSNVYR